LWYIDEINELIQQAEDDEKDIPYLKIKEIVIRQIVEMLNKTKVVRNCNKLSVLLLNREKRTSTGLVKGIAFPHVRSDDVKDFAIALIITKEPIPFETLDGSYVKIILAAVTPTYDDTLHQKIIAKAAQLFEYDDFINNLLNTTTTDEVIRLFRSEEE